MKRLCSSLKWSEYRCRCRRWSSHTGKKNRKEIIRDKNARRNILFLIPSSKMNLLFFLQMHEMQLKGALPSTVVLVTVQALRWRKCVYAAYMCNGNKQQNVPQRPIHSERVEKNGGREKHTVTRVIDDQHITTNDHMRKVYRWERT